MSQTELSIRFAGAADLEFVRQDQALSSGILQRKIEWGEVIVAEFNGVRIGYLLLEYLWSRLPYIAMIHVLPGYRRQAVGKAILKFVEDFLGEQGHRILYSSSQVNEPEPQAWHRQVGFVECGILAGVNDGIGEVFFRKQIS